MKSPRILLVMGMLVLSSLAFYSASEPPTLVSDDGRSDTAPFYGFLSVEQSMQSIHLPEGYHPELVASDPMIKEPVAIAWDGDGKMYVAEMIMYMPNVEGNGQKKPLCRISLLEDTDGDGKMDKSSIFLDSLVLPRMILCVGKRVLVNETDTHNIYSYADTNGDGKADDKKIAYKDNHPNDNNLEHQPSGLVWNLDNRIYVTMRHIRFRYTNGRLKADSVPSSQGQWGIANDDYGRLFYSAGSGENPAFGFQANQAYGNIPGGYDESFQEAWPIIATPDVQGGPYRLRPDSTLNHLTAACGPAIYRGDVLPSDLRGDLLICEPVGRFIRRAKVINTKGFLTVVNAYDKKEFIASTDMNFRPVNMATGPDGALYIVDMHHGIIQESAWTDEGSYLREQILSKGLDKNVGKGRIYRVVPDNFIAGPRPQMLREPSAKLITYLNHPNGWWRDNAQKEIIVRGDKSVVPALKKMASTGSGQLARIHALWTLEGLSQTDDNILLAALKDADPAIRKTAIQIAEDLINTHPVLAAGVSSLQNDPDPNVKIQLVLTLCRASTLKNQKVINSLLKDTVAVPMMKDIARNVQAIGNHQLYGRGVQHLPAADRKLINAGAVIYQQLCATCHGSDAKGIKNGSARMPAPPLVNSYRIMGPSYMPVSILLHGLKGPIEDKEYGDMMAPFGAANSDEWVASVVSYIRYNFGNLSYGRSPMITPAYVKQIRAEDKNRKGAWTMDELNNRKNK